MNDHSLRLLSTPSSEETRGREERRVTVNGQMITLARESRRWTQDKLSQVSGVHQSYISKYEWETLAVKEQHLIAIAKALDYPVNFFEQDEKIRSCSTAIYHRKRTAVPVVDLKMIQAEINLRSIEAARLLQQVNIQTENDFCRLDLEQYTPEQMARELRSAWRLPTGPIRSVTEAVENAGGVVYRWDFGSDKVDGGSQWIEPKPPLFCINSIIPADRARWTLAHEIGHIIMHRWPNDEQESQADQFASEFLMPKNDIIGDLTNLTFDKLAALKLVWRVSMQSLVRRAYTLDQMDKTEYTNWFKRFGRAGMRIREGVEFPHEIPNLSREIIRYHSEVLHLSPSDMTKMLRISMDDYLQRYGDQRAGIRLVK